MGIFRRSVRIQGGPGAISADMEDDYHRFGIDLTHDGEKVVALHGRPLRTPWNTCQLAPNALRVLEGLPLKANPSDFVRQSNARAQCTHMYELTALAGSHALRGEFAADYAADIPYPIGEAPVRALMRRNGELLLDWMISRPSATGAAADVPEELVAGDMIVAPEPYAGRPLRSLLKWAREAVSPELYDAIYIFRRAIGISAARTTDLDALPDVEKVLFSRKGGDCFTFQLANLPATRRVRGSTLDFTARPQQLLSDLPAPEDTPT